EVDLDAHARERRGHVAGPVQPGAAGVEAQRHAHAGLPERVHLLRDLDLLDAREFVLARGAATEPEAKASPVHHFCGTASVSPGVWTRVRASSALLASATCQNCVASP